MPSPAPGGTPLSRRLYNVFCEGVVAERRRHLVIIAEAFELSAREVVVDAIAAQDCTSSTWPCRWVQFRHGWDDSVVPYYLVHLRQLLDAPVGPAP